MKTRDLIQRRHHRWPCSRHSSCPFNQSCRVVQRKPASLQCQSCFAESRGVVGRAVQSTVCSIIAMRRAKSRRVMLSVPSCGSAKKACFRACRVLQSRPVPCNVEQRRAINLIEPRSCHFLRVSCVASVSVAFCRVARSRAMLSNAVRSAQPRVSVGTYRDVMVSVSY